MEIRGRVRRRRGDALVKMLVGVGVLAVAVGFLVGWMAPEPRWPVARPPGMPAAPGGER